MNVTYYDKTFWCDAHSKAEVMKTNKWNWDGELWYTTMCERVLPLYAFASSAAKKKIDKWQASIIDSISDSFAASSSLSVPAPKGMEYRGFQLAGVEYAINHDNDILIADPMGLGKTIQAIGYSNMKLGHAQPLHSKVLTPHGWKKMGDLKLGDALINPMGGIQWCSGIFEQGLKENFKVHFEDGAIVECSEDHLWSVSIDGSDDMVLPTRELRKALSLGDAVQIQTVRAPQFNTEHTLMIEPYIMGMIIAEACVMVNGDLLFDCSNEYVRDELESSLSMLPITTEVEECKEGVLVENGPATYHIFEFYKGWTAFISSNTTLKDKSIFIETLEKDQKELMLQGVMDTVGKPCYGFKAELFAPTIQCRDIVFSLVRSLGGVPWTYSSAEGLRSYMMLPSEFFMFRTEDKVLEYDMKNGIDTMCEPARTIDKIEPSGKEFMRCIRVSSKDKLYVTDDYVVTHNSSPKVVIVCPSTLKENWRREWIKWDTNDMSVGVAFTRNRQKTETNENGIKVTRKWREDVFPDKDVVILNYEQLEKYDIHLKSIRWDLAIVDEADRLGNTGSKMNKCFFGGQHTKKVDGKKKKKRFAAIRARKTIFLTGTPIPKSPINMWSIIERCDPRGLGRNWKSFIYRYCDAQKTPFGLDTTGASNLEELQFKMRKTFMVRRDKREVLTDLPEKQREFLILPKEGLTKQIERELSQARQGMFEFEKMMGIAPKEEEEVSTEELKEFMDSFYLWEARKGIPEAIEYFKSMELDVAFEEFAEARKELSLAKIPMIIDRIDRALEEEDKLVFFGVHSDFLHHLHDHYSDSVIITGKVPVKKRQPIVDTFQEDKDCRIIFGNINAAGVGLTMTAARLTNFGEWHWNFTMNEQAEDRTWRIGQKNACLSQYLAVEGSLDARVAELNWDKKDTAEKALDHKNLDPSKIFVANSNLRI